MILTGNGNGRIILLHKSLLYRIVKHSAHIFPTLEIPVQVFTRMALPYLKEKLLINLILILINSILKNLITYLLDQFSIQILQIMCDLIAFFVLRSTFSY